MRIRSTLQGPLSPGCEHPHRQTRLSQTGVCGRWAAENDIRHGVLLKRFVALQGEGGTQQRDRHPNEHIQLTMANGLTAESPGRTGHLQDTRSKDGDRGQKGEGVKTEEVQAKGSVSPK